MYLKGCDKIPTIQFTYDKDKKCYCYGFWLKGKFIIRGKSKNKNEIWNRFKDELKILESNKI